MSGLDELFVDAAARLAASDTEHEARSCRYCGAQPDARRELLGDLVDIARRALDRVAELERELDQAEAVIDRALEAAQ